MEDTFFEQEFCKSLKKYIDSNMPYEGKGYVSRLAKQLGVSQGQLSNIMAGRKTSAETWRRSVAQKIGISYDKMIGIKANENPIADRADLPPEKKQPHRPPPEEKPSNVVPINAAVENMDRLKKCIDCLQEIFNSGNRTAIRLIEENLSTAKAVCGEPEREQWNEEYRREVRRRMSNH